MNAVFQPIINLLTAAASNLVGPLGILLITVGIVGTIIAIMYFNVQMSHLWKVIFLSVILLAAGAIAAGLHA